MNTDPRLFADEILIFFENLQAISIEVLPETFNGKDQLLEVINETYELIFEGDRRTFRDAIGADVEKTVFGPDGRGREKDAYDLLHLELKYFNTRYAPTAEFAANISHTEKVEAGEVVLGSIQELFQKLPSWLKRVLSVVNEILGVAKAIIGG